ncbi:MAG: glycosyltransferase family 2 protein [Chloroflexi bacterium]|nr:glycosyltransferase family 2 protein [Chloroflexota bacterium]MCL5075042.1 glycosyltransferase family 2 protein [Chloroflexota bacterium]
MMVILSLKDLVVKFSERPGYAIRCAAVERLILQGGDRACVIIRTLVEATVEFQDLEDLILLLSIVIVSWNVKDLLRACLRSVETEVRRSGLSVEVLVVDNASSDGSVAMVMAEFPWVKLIVNDTNVGFTRANNQASSQAQGDYLLLLNPDTELRVGSLSSMTEFMEKHRDVGVLGPQLLYGDGIIQSSRRRFPTLATALVESTILQRYMPNIGLLRRYYMTDTPDNEIQEVDWVVGACFMVRREALSQVGMLDERYYMYSEELDWCYRIKQAGWHVVYFPLAKVIHHEAKSSEQDITLRNIYFHESKCRFFGKHYGRWQEVTLRTFIFLTFLFQLFEESLKFVLVSRNRGMRVQRLLMLLRVSRWQISRLPLTLLGRS